MCVVDFEKERRMRDGTRQLPVKGGRARMGLTGARNTGFESVGSVVNTILEKLRESR